MIETDSGGGSTDTGRQCRTESFSSGKKPSEGDLTFQYEVSNGDGIEYEEFELVNTSDETIDLSGYKIVFENQSTYTIEDMRLIPDSKLRIITYGSPETTATTDSCLQYTHVVRHELDTPLFRDDTARIALASPDGGHVLTETFQVGGSP